MATSRGGSSPLGRTNFQATTYLYWLMRAGLNWRLGRRFGRLAWGKGALDNGWCVVQGVNTEADDRLIFLGMRAEFFVAGNVFDIVEPTTAALLDHLENRIRATTSVG